MTRVATVGAGFGGLAAAVRLREVGIDDVVLFEKSTDGGGVWRPALSGGREHEAGVLVTATGQLSRPSRPDVAGPDRFRGTSSTPPRGITGTTSPGPGEPPPTWIPAGHEVVRGIADLIGGDPGGAFTELVDIPMTAHFLGGCPIGATHQTVVDPRPAPGEPSRRVALWLRVVRPCPRTRPARSACSRSLSSCPAGRRAKSRRPERTGLILREARR